LFTGKTITSKTQAVKNRQQKEEAREEVVTPCCFAVILQPIPPQPLPMHQYTRF
jgi:hypothetical protein